MRVLFLLLLLLAGCVSLPPQQPLTEYEIQGIALSQSGRVAYVAVRAKKEFLVIQNTDGTREDGPAYDEIQTVTFSPGGKSVAYLAKRAELWHVVRDAVEGPGFSYVNSLVFSPDGKNLAYVASHGNETFALLNHNRLPFHADSFTPPVFSPDGKLAYYGRESDQKFLVVDGKRGKSYDYRHVVGQPFYKKDEGVFLFVGGRKERRFLVIGDREMFPNQNVYFPVVSEDGSKLAYVVEGEAYANAVVVEDKGRSRQSKFFRCCISSTLRMDPDGRRVAYIASEKPSAFQLFINEQKIGRTFFRADKLVLSPPGTKDRYAFVAEEEKEGKRHYFAVIDGVEGKRYEDVTQLQFSPSGEAVYIARESDDRQRVITEKGDGPLHDSIEDKLQWDADGKLVYLGTDGRKKFWMRGNERSPTYENIYDLHVVGNDLYAVVNGVELLRNGKRLAREEGIGAFGTPEKYRFDVKNYPLKNGVLKSFAARDSYYLEYDGRTIFEHDDLTGGGPRVSKPKRIGASEVMRMDVYAGDGCPSLHYRIEIPDKGEPAITTLGCETHAERRRPARADQ